MGVDNSMVGHLSLALPGRPSPQGPDYRALLTKLLNRAHIFLIVTVLGAALGFGIQSLITPRYTSATEILLDPKRADSFGADASFVNISVDSAKIASVLSIIQSAELLSRVVQSENLADDPAFGSPSRSAIGRLLADLPFASAPDPKMDRQAREDRALDRLMQAVQVTRAGMTYVLTIEVSATKPETAQRLAAAVASAYLDDQVEAKVAATRRDTQWLADRLEALRHQLEASELNVEAVRTKYGLEQGGSGDREVDAFRHRLGLGRAGNSPAPAQGPSAADINTQLMQVQADVAVRRARCEQVEHAPKGDGSLDSLPEVANSNVIEALRLKQADVVRQIAGLASLYNDNFPELRHARRDAAAIQGRIAAEEARIGATICNDYRTALSRQAALTDQLSHVTVAEHAPPGVEGRMQLLQAQRVVEANQGLYDSLLERRREVEKQQNRHEAEARIITPAKFPLAPSFPKPLLFPIGGAALGLLSSVGFTLFLPMFRNRFVSLADTEKGLALPVLGTVPRLRRRDLRTGRQKLSPVDYVLRRPLSRYAESLRVVRAALRLGDTNGPRIIQVTSALPGEGKSTIAAGLAISAARAGLRPILVDADMRRSSMSAMFNLPAEQKGLVEVVKQDGPTAVSVRDYEGISIGILGVGSASAPQPDIIATSRFATLLQDLSSRYDIVILDSPPVLAVSDALTVASVADVTLLVIDSLGTPRNAVQQAVRALRTYGASLAGVILNQNDSEPPIGRGHNRAIAQYYIMDNVS
jgi:capsular exopolysaccharide synthesis family protein